MKRLALLLVLSGCSNHHFDPPRTLKECREQAYTRFDSCVRSISPTGTCQAAQARDIEICVEAFGDPDAP